MGQSLSRPYSQLIMPKVSFVCSIYNAGKYCEPFLRSLLKQSYTDFEAILVDAASTDGTRELLRKYAAQDKRIKLIEEKFISIAAALNIGLKASQGMYIARVDADNMLFPEFLTEHIEYLDKHPDIELVSADQLKIDENDNVIGMIPFLITDYAMKKHLLFKTAFGGAPMVGKSSTFFYVGLYEERTIITEDRIFALKAIHKKCATLNSINYAYRIHSGAITQRYKKTAEHQKTVQEYEHKFIKPEDYVNELSSYQEVLSAKLNYKSLILQKIATTVVFCGLRLADLGNRTAAINEVEKAITIYPKLALLYRFIIWQIKRGKTDLEKFGHKLNYWLPYTLDFLQFVPLKMSKSSHQRENNLNHYERTLTAYQQLLSSVKQ